MPQSTHARRALHMGTKHRCPRPPQPASPACRGTLSRTSWCFRRETWRMRGGAKAKDATILRHEIMGFLAHDQARRAQPPRAACTPPRRMPCARPARRRSCTQRTHHILLESQRRASHQVPRGDVRAALHQQRCHVSVPIGRRIHERRAAHLAPPHAAFSSATRIGAPMCALTHIMQTCLVSSVQASTVRQQRIHQQRVALHRRVHQRRVAILRAIPHTQHME